MSLSKPALVASLCAALAVPSFAHAGTFDEAGQFVPDPAAVFSLPFDTVTPDQTGMTQGAEPGVLQGGGYAVLETADAFFEQALPALTPGTYTLRFFARHNRVVAGITVRYATSEADFGDPSFEVTAYPTGVVTSDGWYEVASAPFSVDSTRSAQATLHMYASGADVDALEVVREAAPAVAIKTCAKAYDPVCSVNEFCSAGFCRDGNVTVPSVPAAEAGGAAALVAFMQSRLDLFFGGKLTREARLPIAETTLTALAGASSRWEVWNGFATAFHRLRDWHTSMSGPTDSGGRGAFPLCMVEGDADASQSAGATDAALPDILISHGNPDLEASSGLGPGDRIVSIDGQHPVAWMDSLDAIDWGYWHANDPDVHAEAAERMRNAIRRYASELSIVRCDRTAHTCSATAETLRVADLPRTEPELYPACDHRPGYLIDGPDPISHRVRGNQVGMVHDTTEAEGIRAMVWNGVYAQGGNPFASALSELTTGATGVILDHRTGNGGTEYAAELLTQPFRAPALIGASTSFNLTVGLFDEPFDGLSLFNARKNNGQDGYNVGSEDFNPTLKTALLLARDGSASDWFPLGMKGGNPNVRIFGRRTAGAFSSFFQFDYYGNLAWQFASGDYVEDTGATRISRGVEPDEVLLPKQSDLLQGKDTVALRALAWIRGETP